MQKLLSDAFIAQGTIKNAGRKGGYAEPGSTSFLSPDSLSKVRVDVGLTRVSPETLATLQAGLKQYEGTHNYHNFTSKKDGTESSSLRYITAIECGTPFVDAKHGMEWVCISISGQSFLLNQIRKMISLAVEFARGKISLDTFTNCFDANQKIDIAMAPGKYRWEYSNFFLMLTIIFCKFLLRCWFIS